MQPPLITVLIDSYNYGRFIEDAIGSVLTQDFPKEQVEIMVVDDASTDDTAERVKQYGSRVQYFYKPNGGQGSAFNLGLQKAKGEIVALLDADDYWLPGKLQRIAEEFEKHPDAGMVYHRLREYNTRSGEETDGPFVAVSGMVYSDRKRLLSYILYPTTALAFRRRLLEPLLPIPEDLRIQADSHLSGLIIFLAPIVAISEPLAVYRVHGSNLFFAQDAEGFTSERTQRRIATRETLIKDMKSWLKAHGFDLRDRNIRAFFMQWFLCQEADGFAGRTPGRLRFFRHLWRYNYYHWPRLSWRHLVVNYYHAFGSLVVGYKKFYLLDEWRFKVASQLRRSSGREPARAGQ